MTPTSAEAPDTSSTTPDDVPSTSSTARPKSVPIVPSILQLLNVSNASIDEWCVVNYDGMPFPGQIKDVDDDSVEVSTMSRVGNNRFFWPAREDRIWYDYDKIISGIPPVSKVTSRHHKIEESFWEAISDFLDE